MTRDNETIELKPCPFCGCQKIAHWPVKHDDGVVLHTIRCSHCHEGLDGHPSKISAYDRWNTRADRQAPQVDVEKSLDDMFERLYTMGCEMRKLSNYSEASGVEADLDKWGKELMDFFYNLTAQGHLTPKQDHIADISKMVDWQPIETAPKDGTEVLVSDGEYVTPSVWMKPDRFITYGQEGGWCKADYHIGGTLHDGHDILNPRPTHWMPLPKNPKDKP